MIPVELDPSSKGLFSLFGLFPIFRPVVPWLLTFSNRFSSVPPRWHLVLSIGLVYKLWIFCWPFFPSLSAAVFLQRHSRRVSLR